LSYFGRDKQERLGGPPMNTPFLKITALRLHVVFSFVLMGLVVHHASAKAAPAKSQASDRLGDAPLTDKDIQDEMRKHLGVQYRKAGQSEKGFDCSGFVKTVYDEIFGVDLPHQSSQQVRAPELVDVSTDSLKTGDLIFFSTTGKKNAVTHVGIYLSDGKFIHSIRKKGVVVSDLEAPYWTSKIVSARRLRERALPEQMETTRTTLGLAMSFDEQQTVSLRYDQIKLPSLARSLYLSNDERLLPHGGDLLPSIIDDHESGLALQSYPQMGMTPGSWEMTGGYGRQLRLSGDLRPSEGFSITPSLAYTQYNNSSVSAGEVAYHQVSLGLSFDLFSSSDGWSFSTGLEIPIGRYSSDHLGEEPDGRFVDFSLVYQQQLSDRFRLDISGDNLIHFLSGLGDSSPRSDTQDHYLSLMLRYSY
jgi:cell wall-associated NlpC family hydrolase